MNKPISIKQIIESILNKLSIKKASGPDVFTDEFYQTFKEEIISIPYSLFQKTERERTLPK